MDTAHADGLFSGWTEYRYAQHGRPEVVDEFSGDGDLEYETRFVYDPSIRWTEQKLVDARSGQLIYLLQRAISCPGP